ncbi:glutamate-5-semialdehyde dehydrogenase [Chloracidobacterium sp. MS 40/45]|uniref:glutamate-5-semialdehyde dehydrogenase n=1 Tax=Chloracidobacterium aggregatum TaxID=2851959 RepID=UPI001B8CFC42|nr:glutamate-5-semialdehyde dehydrogenase [Chloracidobacterium aggregatum]QUW01493.1 glutamate-5-semialdehyde dehydrogenase [Chloracidobacterium sp. MS 40/45]
MFELRPHLMAAKQASRRAATLDANLKHQVLLALADAIDARRASLQAANAEDLAAAERAGLAAPLRDRLALTDKTLTAMVEGLREIAAQPDPVGEIAELRRQPNGLLVGRMRIPLGVVAIIYESRPNVTVDAAALCLKAGNAVVLRGGSEAFHSNQALGRLMGAVLESFGLPPALVTVIPTPDRAVVAELLACDDLIDLVIPRGGKELIRFVAEHSRIPVIKHYEGVCHTYLDASADPAIAVPVVVNAKAQRPATCNATETLLMHAAAVESCLLPTVQALVAAGVELRVCERTQHALRERGYASERIVAAQPADFGCEFLDNILAIKIVDDYAAAVAHIQTYGSQHTEAIITRDHATAMRFLRDIDSSTVVVNASTRFADGQQLGLGAEIGISTTKLHAFGPMGAHELTTQKFVVLGEGQTRS